MATPNIGWKYYYDYFKQLDYQGNKPFFAGDRSVQQRNQILTTGISFSSYEELTKEALPKLGQYGFALTTCYPGLIIGSGYQHEVGIEEEFKLGFFFDHATGLPILPGSSIKGIIRYVFDRAPSYIADLISASEEKNRPTDEEINLLALEIFGPTPGEAEIADQSVRTQDQFYDAIPIPNGSFTNQLLGKDNITPHRSLFQDPVPLLFLKIMPGVTFQFDFTLRNSKVLPDLDARKKEKLFKTLILDMGVGAKTNVGYGQFLEPEKWVKIFGIEAGVDVETKTEIEDVEIPEKYIRKEPPSATGTTVLYGKIIPATKKDIDKNKPRKGVAFFVGSELQLNNKRSKLLNKFDEGDWVSVTVRYDNKRKQVSEIVEPIEKITKH